MPVGINPTKQFKEPWHITDEFDSTYWSGLDANLYANSSGVNVFLDELVSLQFTLSEQVTPYYGYSNYVPQKMYRGQRIVAGSFTINFKYTHYIYGMLKKLREPGNGTSIKTKATPSKGNSAVDHAKVAMEMQRVGPLGIADFGTAVFEALSATIPRSSAATEVSKVQTNSLKFISASAKELYWTNEGDRIAKAESNSFYSDQVPSNKEKFSGPANGLTINVIYGSEEPSVVFKPNSKGEMSYANSFSDATDISRVYTKGVLSGVEITGVAHAIDDSGRPIMEIYNFIARDWITMAEL
jgi:hypothetical protein